MFHPIVSLEDAERDADCRVYSEDQAGAIQPRSRDQDDLPRTEPIEEVSSEGEALGGSAISRTSVDRLCRRGVREAVNQSSAATASASMP